MCTQKPWREEPASVMGEPNERSSQQTNEKGKIQTWEMWKNSGATGITVEEIRIHGKEVILPDKIKSPLLLRNLILQFVNIH